MTETLNAPVGSPGVLDDPDVAFFDVDPTDDFHDMVAIKLKGLLSPHVNSFAVSQEVGVRLDHGEHWAILHDFTFDALNSFGETVVNNSIHHFVTSTVVQLEMIFRARTISLLGVALLLLNEAFAFTVVEHFGDIATLAAFGSRITVKELRD